MNKTKNPKPRPNILRYFVTGTIVFGVLFLILVVDAIARLYLFDAKPMNVSAEKFITANPVNLEQIIGMSKFRSCQGHEFSGKGADGERESGRSMKHYIVPHPDISQKLNTIEIYAPFDGMVAFSLPGAKGKEMVISPEFDEKWGFVIFHIDPVDGIKDGSHFKAGQLLGHANVKDRHDFDFGLTRTDGSLLFEKFLNIVRGNPQFMLPKANYLVSPFDYMTDAVLTEFEAAGFKPKELQYTDEFRDSSPCDFSKSANSDDDWQYLPGFEPQKPGFIPGDDASQPPLENQSQQPQQLYP